MKPTFIIISSSHQPNLHILIISLPPIMTFILTADTVFLAQIMSFVGEMIFKILYTVIHTQLPEVPAKLVRHDVR